MSESVKLKILTINHRFKEIFFFSFTCYGIYVTVVFTISFSYIFKI